MAAGSSNNRLKEPAAGPRSSEDKIPLQSSTKNNQISEEGRISVPPSGGVRFGIGGGASSSRQSLNSGGGIQLSSEQNWNSPSIPSQLSPSPPPKPSTFK